MTIKIKSFERGCGRRVKGGLYAVCATSPFGKPVEDFLIDSPIPYLGEPFRAPIKHKENLIFWVGESYYPFCPDFIEETKVYGISRRVPLDFKMEGLESFKSKMFFVHSKAVMMPAEEVYSCPKKFENHLNGEERCITALYYHVPSEKQVTPQGTVYKREVGSISYTIPKHVNLDVKYTPGIFMSFPFARFEYILPDNKKVDPRVMEAMGRGVKIQMVEEEGAVEENDDSE